MILSTQNPEHSIRLGFYP